MNFAIDFDGTFAADPETFRKVVKVLQDADHNCFLITNRTAYWGKDVRELVGDLMPIHFAGEFSKRGYAERNFLNIHVWIDDEPDYIDLDGRKFNPKSGFE